MAVEPEAKKSRVEDVEMKLVVNLISLIIVKLAYLILEQLHVVSFAAVLSWFRIFFLPLNLIHLPVC